MDDDFTDFSNDTSVADFADTSGVDQVDFGNVGNLASQFLPVNYNAGVTPAMGSFPALGSVAGAAVAGIATLGGRLAGMFGRGAGVAVINGVKFSMARLWPYIRKYGPMSVATALGMSIEQLGALAMHAPQHAGRKRRRGISARDLATSRRTIKTVKRFSSMLGLGRGRGGGRYYGGRGRRNHYVQWR